MKRKLLPSLFALALLLSGCATSKIYAKDKVDGAYFAVPNGWKKSEQTALAKREAESKVAGAADRLSLVTWQEAYYQKGKLEPADIYSLKAPASPLVYVRVRNLSADEAQSVSYNSLRDIIVPLTDWITKSTDTSKFNLLDDYEVADKHVHGIRSIYTFKGADGVNQTIDQTAVVSDDRTKIFVLLVRAKSEEFSSNKKVLTKIADSFTINGGK